MGAVRTLQLTCFRNYETAVLDHLDETFVVLHGPNGAGKTNMLEAVSLLAPGRGLRSSKLSDFQNIHASVQPWAVAADLDTIYGHVKAGTGRKPDSDQRLIRVQGETVTQAQLGEYFSCVWLTPQMDRLFIDSSSARRRFLDRLIMSFDPGHTGRGTRYENAMRQRSKLLQEGGGDPAWLTGLEVTMAESAVAIAAARNDFAGRLQRASDNVFAQGLPFPSAGITVQGTLEELLNGAPALEVETIYKHQLEQSRERDAITGGAATGPHKTDMVVEHRQKSMPAGQCSTGEQKALLIGLIIAHGQLLASDKAGPPVFLLDEVAAHLDEGRRNVLYEILGSLGGQVWLTGTEQELFTTLKSSAHFCHIENNKVAA